MGGPKGARLMATTWIPISKGLPQEGVEVVALYHDGPEVIASTGVLDPDGRWILSAGSGYDDDEVTHWLPLPEIPEVAVLAEPPMAKVA